MEELGRNGVTLAGVTVLALSGSAEAATLSQSLTFYFNGSNSTQQSLNFNTFDTALGTLDGVSMTLDSAISVSENGSYEMAIIVDSLTASSVLPPSSSTSDYDIAAPGVDLISLTGGSTLFEDDGVATWLATLDVTAFSSGEGAYEWDGDGVGGLGNYSGLTVTYDYTPAPPPSVVPLPATLPLLVGGLAAVGLASRRRRKK